MYDRVFTPFPQLLHLSFTFFFVAIVRCGKTLVICDNRVQQRNINKYLIVCLYALLSVLRFFTSVTGDLFFRLLLKNY